MADRLSSEQWSRYWEKGTLTTFLGRYENNYDGQVLAFWQEHLDELKDSSSIVDVATGNGALALIASELSRSHSKHFAVTAFDYARIDPADKVLSQHDSDLLAAIDFRSEVNMQDTGLHSDSFDCAISQFGFEYGDPTRTVRETSRILRPQSTLLLMLHREGSILYKQAQTGISQVDICARSPLHDQLKELLPVIEKLLKRGKDPSKNEKAEQLREIINETTNDLHEAMDSFEDPTQLGFFLENSMAVFRPQFRNKSAEQKSAMLDDIAAETSAYQQRMQDLLSACSSENDIRLLEKALEEEGFNIEQSDLIQVEGHDFCHALVAKR